MNHYAEILNILLQVLLILPRVRAYAQPLPCLGACWAHDPSLIQRDDGTYFRFSTNGGIHYQKSSGGINGPWKSLGEVLTTGYSIVEPAVTDLWAPDVHKIGCQYVMYYSVSHINTQNSTIGYATSPTMEPGTWMDHGSAGIVSHPASPGVTASPYNAIDSALIQVDNIYYMSFGSYWSNIFLTQMNADATAPLAVLPASATNIQRQPNGARAAEASFVYFYTPPGTSVGYFYLFWSEGQANDYATNKPAAGSGLEYKIRVCRSTSVTGPYTDTSSASCTTGAGELVLASHDLVYGPGAQGIIDDAQGPIIYYRYANLSRNLDSAYYQWGYNYLSWPNGWPVVSDDIFTYSYSLTAPATYTDALQCPATTPTGPPLPSSGYVSPTSALAAFAAASCSILYVLTCTIWVS